MLPRSSLFFFSNSNGRSVPGFSHLPVKRSFDYNPPSSALACPTHIYICLYICLGVMGHCNAAAFAASSVIYYWSLANFLFLLQFYFFFLIFLLTNLADCCWLFFIFFLKKKKLPFVFFPLFRRKKERNGGEKGANRPKGKKTSLRFGGRKSKIEDLLRLVCHAGGTLRVHPAKQVAVRNEFSYCWTASHFLFFLFFSKKTLKKGGVYLLASLLFFFFKKKRKKR